MIMLQYGVDEDAAFGLSIRTSSHSNQKLRDIAAKMVEDANSKARASRQGNSNN